MSYDKVTQASMNSLYVKAKELDRGHNEWAAPGYLPPGVGADLETHASTHASDAPVPKARYAPRPQASKVPAAPPSRPPKAIAPDSESHASTHASNVE